MLFQAHLHVTPTLCSTLSYSNVFLLLVYMSLYVYICIYMYVYVYIIVYVYVSHLPCFKLVHGDCTYLQNISVLDQLRVDSSVQTFTVF